MVTRNTLQVFYQCEAPDVWLVLTLRKGGKPKPGVPPPVENDGASDDRVLRMQQLARMCWNTFALFHGNTKSIISRQGRQGRDGWDAVRGALREFMPRYLPGIQLDRPGDVLMALGGMHFLPVDKQSYLRIQLMINALEMRFRTIVGTVFLYDGDLISSGLEMEPTRLIYAFLSAHLFGEPARRPDPAPKRSGGFMSGLGMSGDSPRDRPPECGMDMGVTASRWNKHFGVMHAKEAGKGMMPLHTVYIGGDVGHVGRVRHEPDPEPEPEPEPAAGKPPARYHLLVYSQPPATLVFVFQHPDGPYETVAAATEAARIAPKAAGPDLADFTTFIKPMLEQELMNLAQAIGSGGRRKASAQQSSGGSGGSEFRFVYFNRMNLAVKVSDGFGGGRTGAHDDSSLSDEFLRQLGSMHLEFSAEEGVREVCAKTGARLQRRVQTCRISLGTNSHAQQHPSEDACPCSCA